MAEEKRVGTVLVVGAGIAGIKAALELAEIGYKVLLTDASPQVGGILSKLDHQFPTDHCGLCRMLPLVGREQASEHCMRKGLFHDNIEILPFTEVTSIEGDAGAYKVGLLKQARHVNADICNGLGKCIDVCPVEVPDEFNNGLTTRKAIYQPIPHNVPQMFLVDMDACNGCGECVKICPSDAIDLSMQEERLEAEVDAIVFASGTTLYDPEQYDDAKSYTASEDVVSSLTFERILSASGTYDGQIRRPSDGKPARRIAWIQCMGSRNRRHHRDYCSSICCMFALKEAVLAHEKGGDDTETTIFYMDMRTFGKDFYRYRERAEETHGVRLVRCRVQEVLRQADGTLLIRYFDPLSGGFQVGVYDMVVLSTGQTLFEDHKRLAELTGLPLSSSELLQREAFEKVRLLKPGLFICGSLMGLTDISEAIISGSAAAGEVSRLLASLDKSAMVEPLAKERPVGRERPLVAVILCDSRDEKAPKGMNLSPLLQRIEALPGVGEVHVVESLCHETGRAAALEILSRTRCNRVLFGACLPNVYRQKIRRLARTAGFNAVLIDVFDLYSTLGRCFDLNGACWVDRVTEDVWTNVERLKRTEALLVDRLPISQTALVVGGGVAGMRAALSLAKRGIAAHIVEKGDRLGGHAAIDLRYTVDGMDPAGLTLDLSQQAKEHPNVTVHLKAEVVSTKSAPGRYSTEIRHLETGDIRLVEHGAVILATGGQEGTTTEYGLGESERVLRQVELEQRLSNGDIDPASLETVVMIQCVGSREKGKREYCSRICCAATLKNAFKILEKNPDARVIVLYRDMMTYGQLEPYYTEARGRGVVFVSYDLDRKPEVEITDGVPTVKYVDPVLRMPFTATPDLLVLATGIVPSPSNRGLAEIFGLPLNEDGFFVEADPKWRPVELMRSGAFFAGMAHSPQPINDVLMQAEAVAHKAYTYLSKTELLVPRVVAKVHHALCARCRACIDVCPFEARAFSEEEHCITVDPSACQACGACQVACRNAAAEVLGWNDKQVMAIIDAKLSGSEAGRERQELKEMPHG
jgi:heterodisulfide reductase subunit A2